MTEELKIRIHNHKRVENQLRGLGAVFLEEIKIVDTYFKQPSGKVLKVTEDDKGHFLVKLRLAADKFEIVKHQRIFGVEKLKKELTNSFGMKCVLKKRRRFWNFLDYKININLIDGVGDFLVVEGEGLRPEMITEKLKIENPEFITVSFDGLEKS